MFKVLGIDHIVIRTANIERMKSFYRDVLQCEIERDKTAELGLLQLRAGSALIDLVSVSSELGKLGGAEPGLSGNNLDHFCLQLRAIEQQVLLSYLKQHQVVVDEFSERYGATGYGLSIYIKDPDGNTIELKPV